MSNISIIEKLKGRENYDTWKLSVKTLLEYEGLWNCVIDVDTNANNNTKARTKIILLIEPINYIHVQSATTAKEVWENLEKVFQDSGLTRKVGLLSN